MTGEPRPMGEFDLIERFFSRPPAAGRTDVVLGVGDDAALLTVPPGSELVAAVDTLVAGRHFPFDCDPRSIGHRALAVNLSDMAAMGATPAWATLALTLPAVDAGWLAGFAEGLLTLADAHGVALVGGDTTAGPLTISVQIMGYVAAGTALRRSGARAGDLLAVTGTLGDAGAGLALATDRLQPGDLVAAAAVTERFDYPTPRVRFGACARGLASAAMDVSDGLAGDLPKLAHASSLAAHVDVGRLPLSPALTSLVPLPQALAWALAAGDDYELLLAVAPEHRQALAAEARRLHLNLTVIGELRRGNGVHWTHGGAPFAAPAHGYDHFRGASTQVTV
jgi:thiamine-monophosphate kinase